MLNPQQPIDSKKEMEGGKYDSHWGKEAQRSLISVGGEQLR